MMTLIEGIKVDLDSLLCIKHDCRPELCRSRPSCCSCYEVCLGDREISRITGMMPHIVKHAKHLVIDDYFDNPFEKIGRNLYSMDTDYDNLCLFAYHGKDGCTWCSIHSAALEIGIDIADVKPVSCILWPLSLSEDDPPVLSVQSGAFDFPCNMECSVSDKLDPNISDIICKVFGLKFLDELNE